MQDNTEVCERFAEIIGVRGVSLFNQRTTEELEANVECWKRDGFLFIGNALTSEAIELLNHEITFAQRNSVHDIRQFYRVHNDDNSADFISGFLHSANSFYSTLLRSSLVSEYGFAMQYIKNSDMDPHYDNYNNNISSTICYHATPDGLKNPIFVDKAKFLNPYTMRVTIKDRDGVPKQNVAILDLKPGDRAIFRGRNHLHWRNFIPQEMDYRALLLHYSDYTYKGRAVVGHQIPNIIHDLIDFDNYDAFREEYAMYFETSGKEWI